MGLLDSHVCRRCEAQEWTSTHILASIRHTSDTEFLFLGPSGYQKSKSGGNLELIKETGLPWLELQSSVAQRACEQPACITIGRALFSLSSISRRKLLIQFWKRHNLVRRKLLNTFWTKINIHDVLIQFLRHIATQQNSLMKSNRWNLHREVVIAVPVTCILNIPVHCTENIQSCYC